MSYHPDLSIGFRTNRVIKFTITEKQAVRYRVEQRIGNGGTHWLWYKPLMRPERCIGRITNLTWERDPSGKKAIRSLTYTVELNS
jgi:hypothetical protein